MSRPTVREQRRRTVITCKAPDASQVLLAGTFNDWKPEATPMKRRADGQWEVALDLPPGHYEYKFLVDGRWCCEPGQVDDARTCVRDGCVPNECGTLNRVLELR